MIDTIYKHRDDAVLRVLQDNMIVDICCILLSLDGESGHKSDWTIKQSLNRLIAQGRVQKISKRGYGNLYHSTE
jgi:hypothetical protein